MGVGVEREPRRVMPQHAREGLDIHAVLERQRRESVAQVIEPDVLDAGLFQQALMYPSDGVGVVHRAGDR